MLIRVCFTLFTLVVMGAAQAANVLLLGDNEAETQVQQALEGAGHTVTFGGIYYDWDGITPNVNDFDVVVYLNGTDYGYALQPVAASAIDQFVSNGGGLILTEWTAYDVYDGYKSDVIAKLMPAATPDQDYDYGFTWNVVDNSHPLANSLPSSWFDEAGSSYVSLKQGSCAVILGTYEDDGDTRVGNPLLSYSVINGGIVVYINHDMTYTTDPIIDNAVQVISNSVEFAAEPLPSGVCGSVSPVPMLNTQTLILLILSIGGVGWLLRRRVA